MSKPLTDEDISNFEKGYGLIRPQGPLKSLCAQAREANRLRELVHRLLGKLPKTDLWTSQAGTFASPGLEELRREAEDALAGK